MHIIVLIKKPHLCKKLKKNDKKERIFCLLCGEVRFIANAVMRESQCNVIFEHSANSPTTAGKINLCCIETLIRMTLKKLFNESTKTPLKGREYNFFLSQSDNLNVTFFISV